MCRVFLLCVLSASIWAQSPPTPEPQVDTEALKIVRAVMSAQHGGEERFDLNSFTGHFRFRVFEYGDDGKLRATRPGTIDQAWARRTVGEGIETAYRRTLTTDNTRAVTLLLDFNNRAWKIPQDRKSPPILLRRKEHKKDRENLRAEAGRINRLLDSFLLKDASDLKKLRLIAKGEAVQFAISREPFEFKVCDRIGFTDNDGTAVEWWVDRSTHRVVKSQMTPPEDGKKKVISVFHMGYHTSVKVSGGPRHLVVPHWISYLENASPVLEIITSRKGAIKINTLGDADCKKLFQARSD